MSDSFFDQDCLEGENYIFQMSSLSLVKKNSNAEGKSTNSVSNKARVLHEYDHMMRLLGTPYGLIRHGFMTNFLEYFLKAFRVRSGLDPLVKDWLLVKQKIRPNISGEEFNHVYFGDKSYSDIYRAQCFLNAIRTLDGSNLNFVGIDSMAGWAEYVIGLIGVEYEDKEAFRLHLKKLWGNRPQRGKLIYIDQKPVSSHDMLEYLGVVVEMAYQVKERGAISEFPADLSERVYLQILNAVKTYLPEVFDYENYTMAQELEALLELCYWIPLWPGMEVDDLLEHAIYYLPSYRLEMILDAARVLKLPFSFENNMDVNDIAPKAKKFQESICQLLSWPTPTAIAAKWHIALEYIDDNSSQWHKAYFHHPKSRRLSWSKQLIQEFSANPVTGPMLAGSNHYGKINFPLINDQSNSMDIYLPNGEIDWPEEDRDFQKLDLLLFTAATFAVNPNDWLWLPKPVRVEAQETWSRLAGAGIF